MTSARLPTPSPTACWTIGSVFEWQGRTYQILSVDWDELTLQAQDMETAAPTMIPLKALWGTNHPTPTERQVYDPADPKLVVVTATGLPESFLTKAELIVDVVETTRRQVAEAERQAYFSGTTFQYTAALKRILKARARPVGLTTYYKYRKLYDTYAGDRVRIAASFRRTTFNQTTMSAAQLHFIDQIIVRYGARHPPRRPRDLYHIARSTWEHTGHRWIDPNQCQPDLPQDLIQELLDHRIPMPVILSQPEKAGLLVPIELPSESWFYQYWRWFETQPETGKTVFIHRYGQDTWDNEMQVFDTFAHHAVMPLQYVFADHWLVDVFIVDEATRQERQRLWFTALIDAYSRCILGMVLLYEDPSIWSIQAALQHAIWVKTSHEALGVAGVWGCFGIPLQLFLDNAWAHHSYSLEDLARAISQGGQYPSIDLVFRPPYKGRYGALIERYFGHLSARMKTELPGAIPGSHPREVRGAAESACLLYEDVDRFIHQEILTYLHTPHRELDGLTPHEKWQMWMETTIPQVPPPTAAVQRLFWRMDPQTRVITPAGINAFGMQYTSPGLNQAERVNRAGQPTRYSFRYDPADISCLALFKDGRWVGDVYAKQLRQPDGSHHRVSLAQHQLAHEAARREGRSSRDWLRYVNESEALYRQRRAEQRQTNQRARPKANRITDPQKMTQALEQLADENRTTEVADLLNQFLSD